MKRGGFELYRDWLVNTRHPCPYLAAILYFRPDLSLVKIGQQKESGTGWSVTGTRAFYPASLAMYHMFEFPLRSGLSIRRNRRSKNGASLREHLLTATSESSGFNLSHNLLPSSIDSVQQGLTPSCRRRIIFHITNPLLEMRRRMPNYLILPSIEKVLTSYISQFHQLRPAIP